MTAMPTARPRRQAVTGRNGPDGRGPWSSSRRRGLPSSPSSFALGILAPWIAPHGVDAQSSDSFAGISAAHLFGTDEFGRDVFTPRLFGIRQDVIVTGLAVPIGASGGHRLGLLCGTAPARWTPIVQRALRRDARLHRPRPRCRGSPPPSARG